MKAQEEYTEERRKPGKPEMWSWHWWQAPRRDGLYGACRLWGQVVRWRRSPMSQGCPWPTHHVSEDQVWVEVEGVRTLVMRKYLPQRTTRQRDPLPAVAYPYLGIEQLVLDVSGREPQTAETVRGCLARQFVHGSGRVLTAKDSKGLWDLMERFIRLGQARF